MWYLLGGAAVVALGWIWLGGGGGADADAYLTARVERGPIRNLVAATGTIQAVLTVQVGSQVTGRIQSLLADYNSVVKAGQVLARIDPANFDAQLERARADLSDARAGVRTAEAAVATQKANLEAARVASEDARRALDRARELGEEGVVSDRDLEVAGAAHEQAAARVEQARAQVRSAEAALEQARARVDQARAAVTMAEVNLVYTVISSPVDGVVISRSVDVGQTVSASLQAPTLFTIANDLTRMQVVASVDEADIGLITPEARVAFAVDAFPGETFTGNLNQIRLNPQTQQNVVTYSVIVDVDNPDLKLRPGMTANTTFTIAERDDALRLPNAALRFWPEEVPREKERELIAQGAGPARPEPEAPPEGGGGGVQAAPARRPASRGGGWTGRAGTPAGGAEAGAAPGVQGDGQPEGSGARAAGAAGSSPYLPEAGQVIRFPAGRKAAPRPRVVWVLGSEGTPRPRVVMLGISDGSATEVVGRGLEAGEVVIIGRNITADASAAQSRSPFGMGGMMRPGGGAARTGAKAGR